MSTGSQSAPESALTPEPEENCRAATGVEGLDYILGGGFPRNRIYLVEGHPGSGKTTLGLQFLLEGRKCGETGLCISLSENREEMKLVADSHGWSLDGIELYELEKLEDQFKPETQYTVFHAGEVELSYTMNQIRRRIEDIKPSRVVFDSLSELRLLAEDPLRFRREMLGIKQFLADRQCTTLLLDDVGYQTAEPQVRSIVHGVLLLERVPAEYGSSRRRLSLVKMRGVKFRDGFHDFALVTGGLEVYPRLADARERLGRGHDEPFSSGIAELDQLLEGGLDRGTSTVMIGPAGCGKSTLATLYAHRAVEKGERAACYLFEESCETFFDRASGMGMSLDEYAGDRLLVQQVDPAEMSPGEFSHRVREAVSQRNTSVVVIDSLNGYLNAMPSERYLLMHMHELLGYLARQGVMTILIVAQYGLLGQSMQTPVDITYLADTVIVLRYFEAAGEVKQALSVIKKRKGGHERTIREMRFTSEGIRIGRPLHEFRGILTGVPVFTGTEQQMLAGDGNA